MGEVVILVTYQSKLERRQFDLRLNRDCRDGTVWVPHRVIFYAGFFFLLKIVLEE